jgi:hypothetical protein
LDKRELQVALVHLDPGDLLALVVELVPQVSPEQSVQEVLQVRPVPQEQEEGLVPLDSQDPLAHQDHLDQQDLEEALGPRVDLDLLDLQAPLDPLAELARLVLLEALEQLDPEDSVDHQVQLDAQAPQVSLVVPVVQVLLVLPVLPVAPEQQDSLELLVQQELDCLDPRDPPDPPDVMELEACRRPMSASIRGAASSAWIHTTATSVCVTKDTKSTATSTTLTVLGPFQGGVREQLSRRLSARGMCTT